MAKHPDYPAPVDDPDSLPKNYEGLAREQFWQAYWDRCGVYKFEPAHADGTLRTRDEIFSIDTPPPTVSGALHIGHVYSYTQTDMNARYQRMRGKHLFYPFGFDDNGLPTERLVEKVKNIRAHEVSREEFIRMCQEVVEPAEAEFIALWRSLAISCDWEQFYTTIDERSRAISQSSFIDLYNRGFIYRKVAPTQWDWVNQTAIAQAEIEDREVPGHFHDIRFGWANGPGEPVQGELVIATTRPELIPACVAVFAHPEDERYKHLFGKVAITPLFEVEVPILPSEKANPEKGTGILMCCTFGDMDDVEHWKEHNLPLRIMIGKDGRVKDLRSLPYSDFTDEAGHRYVLDSFSLGGGKSRNEEKRFAYCDELSGLKIAAARTRIRELLNQSQDLISLREISHTVRFAERGDVPVEILVTPQWYVNILDHKEALLEQGRKVNWHPEYMRKRYEQWVEGLNTDWCISRQRYNGVPFPVWYDHDQPMLAETEALPVNPLRDLASTAAIENSWEQFEIKFAAEHAASMQMVQERLASDPGLAAEASRQAEEFISNLQPGDLPDPPTEAEFEALGKMPLPEELVPDPDVMDTWATSSTTPYLNTHLLLARGEDGTIPTTERHAQLFPFDMRPQAHDIIRTWAFYTIAKAYFHFGEIPWQDIVISGHAQDAGGKKISKSKGHVVTPAEMVEKYTADGLRYWSGSARLGADTLYDERNLTEGRKLINKLFNATKFALRHLIDFNPGSAAFQAADSGEAGRMPALPITYPTDLWLLSRLNDTIERATRASDAFEFGEAKQAVEDFFWADLCDNYLELSKGRLYGEPLAVEAHDDITAAELRTSAQATLHLALSSVLRMFAPVLPHITEECWSWHFARFSDKRSIHEEPWPVPVGAARGRPSPDVAVEEGRRPAAPTEDSSIAAATLLLPVVAAVRKWKSEQNVSVKKPLATVSIYRTEHAPRGAAGAHVLDGMHLHAVLGDLMSTCNAQQVFMLDSDAPANAVSTERSPIAVTCELAPEPE